MRTGLEEIAELVEVVERAAVETTDRLLTEMGMVPRSSIRAWAVIDRRSFAKVSGAIQAAHCDPTLDVIAGGTADDSVGYFVRPTIVVGSDHNHEVFRTEYFGPLLAVHATATSTRCSDTSTAAPPTASPVP